MNVKYNPLEGCPNCGGINTESDMHMIDPATIHWDVLCNDCGFRWFDVYKYTRSLAEFSDDDDDELYVIDEEEDNVSE